MARLRTLMVIGASLLLVLVSVSPSPASSGESSASTATVGSSGNGLQGVAECDLDHDVRVSARQLPPAALASVTCGDDLVQVQHVKGIAGGAGASRGQSYAHPATATSRPIVTYAGGDVGDGRPAREAMVARGGNVADLAFGPNGSLYIADSSSRRIRRIDSSGTITTVAGTGVWGYSGDGGPATAAALGGPAGIEVDVHGNVYFWDKPNWRIRKIDAQTGTISTIAGKGVCDNHFDTMASGDGKIATEACLWPHSGLALDREGRLYFGYFGTVFFIDGAGRLRAYFDVSDQCKARPDHCASPGKLQFDHQGNLYLLSGNRLSKLDQNGRLTRVAGVPAPEAPPYCNAYGHVTMQVCAAQGYYDTAGYSGDGGPADEAALDFPTDFSVTPLGEIYIADMHNQRIRRIDRDGIITTVAGDGFQRCSKSESAAVGIGFAMVWSMRSCWGRYGGDGGPAVSASLSQPSAVAVARDGHFVIFDAKNRRVRGVRDGTINMEAGIGWRPYGDGEPADNADLVPRGTAVDAHGNLYIADHGDDVVRKVDRDGIITTIAGRSDPDPERNGDLCYPLFHETSHHGDGGPAVDATLCEPTDVAVDAEGNVFIADSGNHAVRKVSASGVITTVAGSGEEGQLGDGLPATMAQLHSPSSVHVDAAGNLYIADTGNHRIRKVGSSGLMTTVAGTGNRGFSGDGLPAGLAALSSPSSVATDDEGNVFIADTGNHRIRKVDTAGMIRTVAGAGVADCSPDGPAATSVHLNHPLAVAPDPSGGFLVADTHNHRILHVDVSGTSMTVAGSAACTAGFGGDGGPGEQAMLNLPLGISADGRRIYVADEANYRVRMLERETP